MTRPKASFHAVRRRAQRHLDPRAGDGRPGRVAGRAGACYALATLQQRDRRPRCWRPRTGSTDGGRDRPRPVDHHRAPPADGARPAPADRHLEDHRQPRARRRRGRHASRARCSGSINRERLEPACACRSTTSPTTPSWPSAQLRKALDAFARLDVDRAVEVLKRRRPDRQGIRRPVRKLITYMMEDPRTISVEHRPACSWPRRSSASATTRRTSPSRSSTSSRAPTCATLRCGIDRECWSR